MRNKWEIKRNGVAFAFCDKLEYSGSWMGECFVTVTVTSPTPIDFHIGDYIEYRNELFVLNNVPTVSKKASSGSYGEAFTYENVKFSARSTELTDVMFLDVVLADNNIHYTALPDFPFFSSDIEDFADRLQANTNQWCTANGLELSDYWLFITPNFTRFKQRVALLRIDNNDNWEGLTPSQAAAVFTASYPNGVSRDEEKKDVNLTVSSKRVWDMMSEIKNSFGLNFITRGRHVVIGANGIEAEHIFEYGKGNGLYEIERTADTEQQVITKLYSYGTDKNMPVRYYANLNIVCFATVTKVSFEGETFYVIDIPYSRGCYTDKRHFEIGIFSGRLKNHNYYVAHATKDEDEYNLGICSFDEYKEELLEEVSAESRARAEEYLSEWSDATHSLIFGRHETEELDFSTNDELIFVSGMNKDKWPSMKRTTPGGEQALPNNMSVSKLMLPGFPLVSLRDWVEEHKNDEDKSWLRDAIERGYTFSKEQYNPYILSPNVSALGIRESSKSFDGSEEDEVYPTIENTGMDHLLSAETVTDNGIFDDGDTTPTVEITLPFNVDEFKLKELATTGVQDGGSPTISIKSGYCGGCEFSFNDGDVTEVNGHWKVKCERYKNDLLGIYFPYSYNASIGTTPAANEAFQLRGSDIDFYDGDKYVLTGIPMTDFYIDKAAEKLLQVSLVFLSKNDYTRYTYSPKVDELFMARQHDNAVANNGVSMYLTLKEGDLMDFSDTDLSIEGSVFIDTLVITENGNNGIPTYQVTLRNDKTVGMIQRLQEKVDSIVSGSISANGGSGGSVSTAQVSKIVNNIGSQNYLSKVAEDAAQEMIGFVKGLWVKAKNLFGIDGDGNANVRSLDVAANASVTGNLTAAGVIANLLKTPGFEQAIGLIGQGFGVTTSNGKATLQTDDLIVLGQMIVNSLNIREVSYIGGVYLLTPAGSTVEEVTPLYSNTPLDTRTWEPDEEATGTPVGYRLLWKADDGTTETMNYWKQGDQAFCEVFNIREAGTYNNFSNRRYWRLVVNTGTANHQHYADVSNTDYVNLYDGDTQLVNVAGSTTFAGYENANGTVPAVGDKAVCLGSQYDTTRQGAVQITAEGTASIGIYDGINNYANLSTHEIHLFSKEKVRMNAARFEWTTENNISMPPTVYCGDWTTGKTSVKGYEWTYNDTRWLYIGENSTTEAPGTTAANWQEVKGATGAAAVMYQLVPNVTGIKLNDDGTYTPTTISCQQKKIEGSNATMSVDYYMAYYVDGGSRVNVGKANMSVSLGTGGISPTKSVTISLYKTSNYNASDLLHTVTLLVTKNGEAGDPATVYTLIPSLNIVHRDSDHIPTTDTISFKVSKTVGGETTEVSNWNTEGLRLYHNIGGNDVDDGTVSGATKTVTGIQNGLYYENDSVVWILKKGSSVVDSKTIGIVENGSNGDPGSPGSTGAAGYSVIANPATITLNESLSTPNSFSLPQEITFSVEGNSSVTVSNVAVSDTSNIAASRYSSTKVRITAVGSGNPTQGYVTVTVTLSTGSTVDIKVLIAINWQGTINTTIQGSVEQTVAQKVNQAIEDGNFVTTETTGVFVRSDELNVSELTETVNGVVTSVSKIQQTADNVFLGVFEGNSSIIKNPYFYDTSSLSMVDTWGDYGSNRTRYSITEDSNTYYYLRQTVNTGVSSSTRNLAQQTLPDKTVMFGGEWYTFAFYARHNETNTIGSNSVSSTSAKTIATYRYPSGTKYILTITGRVSNANGTLTISCGGVSATIRSTTSLTVTLEVNGSNVSQALQIKMNSSSYTGYVTSATVNKSLVVVGFSSVINTSESLYIDGEKYSGSTTSTNSFVIDSKSWELHTLTFKTLDTTSTRRLTIQSYGNNGIFDFYKPSIVEGIGALNSLMKMTGIDIQKGKITAIGDNFEWKNTNNETLLGLDSAGNAEFAGVVKARGFYHQICTFWPSNNYQPAWRQFTGTTNAYFVKGVCYKQSELNAMETTNPSAYSYYDNNTSEFSLCTGYADIVNYTIYEGSETTYHLNLPDPAYCQGMSVELYTFNFINQAEATFKVGSIAGTVMTYAVYPDPNVPGQLRCSTLSDSCVGTFGCTYRFVSTYAESQGVWVWWCINVTAVATKAIEVL